jgi:glycosyltransferase involved in cell wall biosynthesis
MKISALCITYGRPHLLEEAIESFLRQDYQNKELIIVNDLAEQELIFNHPQVKIFNFKERFKTIGDKRNKSVELSSGDILTSWDDDDIYLPWLLSQFVKVFEENDKIDFIKPDKAWIYNDNKFTLGSGWCAYIAFSRKAFYSVGGYKSMNSGQDMDLLYKLKKYSTSVEAKTLSFSKEESAYIFRWAGTNSYHLSSFGKDKEGRESGFVKTEKYIKSKIIESIVELKPHWELDYLGITRKILEESI